MFSKTKTILATAAVAVTGVLGVAGVASAAGTASSSVTIKGENGDYNGRVKSSSKFCTDERTVVVYKMTGSRPKPSRDRKIGSDLTDGNGKWSAGNTGYKTGKFYARVGKRELARPSAQRGPSFCGAATSDVIKR